MNKTYIKMALVTLAVMAIAARVKMMNPTVEKLLTGGIFTPVGNQNNTSTVVTA